MCQRNKRTLVMATAALALGILMPATSVADPTYPNRPIRLVIPFPPGGPTDVFGRLFGQQLAVVLGQPVVPENRPGAGSAIGVSHAANADPDGYTVLFGTGSIATGAAMTKLPYDPRKDIVPVAHAGIVPLVLLTAPNMPDSVPGLLAHLRANPGKMSYGSAGPGTTTHLAGEMFKLKAKVDPVHVPYKGSAPALADAMGGRVAFVFETITASKAMFTSGRLNLIAVGTKERSPLLPDVPTVSEGGVPDMAAYTWNVVFVPAGTPPAIIDRLNKASNQVLGDPAFAKRMAELATQVVSDSTPESSRDFYFSELDLWASIVQQAGLRSN